MPGKFVVASATVLIAAMAVMFDPAAAAPRSAVAEPLSPQSVARVHVVRAGSLALAPDIQIHGPRPSAPAFAGETEISDLSQDVDLSQVSGTPEVSGTPDVSQRPNVAQSPPHLVVAQASSASPDIDAVLGGQNKSDANAGTVTIMTTRNLGAPFMQAALDLSNLLDAGERFEEMRVVPVVARGKVQNLWDILYLRGIDMGFVQSDILEYLKDDPRLASIKSRLRYVTVMYPEEVHVIAAKEVKSLRDLAGKTVSINAKGTGSSVVGTILMQRLGIDANLIHEDTRRAVARIKSGEIAAHFNVLGKPTPVVSRIESEGKLHLLPVPYTDALSDVYLPSELTSKDYPNLITEGETVPTIAVGNVLATFNWPGDSLRGRKVRQFVDAFFSRFEELKQEGYHPKWKDVNLAATMPGWTRLEAAQEWLDTHAPAESPQPVAEAEAQGIGGGDDSDLLRERFAAFLAERGLVAQPGKDPEAVEALFEEFTRWQNSRR